MDTVGDVTFTRAKRSLAPRGRLLLVASGLPSILAALALAPFTGKRIVAGPATERAEDQATLASLAERGVYRPLIDRTVAFDDIREAHARVDTGRKRGSVVVAIGRGGRKYECDSAIP